MFELLNQKQAARIAGLSPRTFEKMRYEDRGPKWRKIGRAVRYERKDLEDWLRSMPVVEPSGQ